MRSNADNPMQHFQEWFYEVDNAYPEEETNAMLFSTIGLDGFPKSRIVLLKRFTWEGFVFFTNYNSEKGKAIANNNNVSIRFDWKAAKRNIIITGKAEKIAKNLSEGYFESRPTGSKLSTWASKQSEVIGSREELDNQLQSFATKFKNKAIPKPEYWGGYIIKPTYLEFTEHNQQLDTWKSTCYTLKPDYNWVKETRFVRH